MVVQVSFSSGVQPMLRGPCETFAPAGLSCLSRQCCVRAAGRHLDALTSSTHLNWASTARGSTPAKPLQEGCIGICTVATVCTTDSVLASTGDFVCDCCLDDVTSVRENERHSTLFWGSQQRSS